MASTITLQNSITWAMAFIRNQPINSNTGNEPSISSANIVLQTILGPPFIWSWNRNANATQSTTAGTQDYSITIADWGFFEKATVTDPTGNVTELEWKQILSAENVTTTNRARPTYISTQQDDNAGDITFRLMPVPDQVYGITIIYQKAAILFSSLSGTWAPIPDRFEYIYNRGFLAFSMEAAQDARFVVEHQRFVATLVSASEGLSEMQKNLFLGNALSTATQAQTNTLKAQHGSQGRIT
jgi:hypothetical protein